MRKLGVLSGRFAASNEGMLAMGVPCLSVAASSAMATELTAAPATAAIPAALTTLLREMGVAMRAFMCKSPFGWMGWR